MQRLLVFSALLLAVPWIGATGVVHAASQATSSSAPLDAYFGSQKVSALVIRHQVDALGRRYHDRTITDDDLVHDAALLETAMLAWQHQYPRDPWVVPAIYHLEQLFQAVQSDDARTHAKKLLQFLATTYPDTKEAHASRLRLAQGLPPLHAEVPAHATPNPYSSAPSPAPTAADGAPSPAPSAT